MIVGGENRTWIYEGGMTGAGLCPYCWAWFPTLSALFTHKQDDHQPLPQYDGSVAPEDPS